MDAEDVENLRAAPHPGSGGQPVATGRISTETVLATVRAEEEMSEQGA